MVRVRPNLPTGGCSRMSEREVPAVRGLPCVTGKLFSFSKPLWFFHLWNGWFRRVQCMSVSIVMRVKGPWWGPSVSCKCELWGHKGWVGTHISYVLVSCLRKSHVTIWAPPRLILDIRSSRLGAPNSSTNLTGFLLPGLPRWVLAFT
jgi:hypothetical protein